MTELRVHNFSLSLDGYAAGPDQSPEQPLGAGGEALHEWIFPAGSRTPVDEAFVQRGVDGIGATIMEKGPPSHHRSQARGGPLREAMHHDVFVLTHVAREPVAMAGGTTFHFVTDGIESALDHARGAAGDADVRLGGGVATVQEYLRAGLVDELHLAVVPVLLHGGERLFEGLGNALDGWRCVEFAPSASVTHVRLRH
jgi:dihydrofolate reductase